MGTEMTKDYLITMFDAAREVDAPFIFVSITAEGTKEVIVVPNTSFTAKEAFYNGAYNEDLVHVMNSKVSITGLAYGPSSVLDELD